MNTTCYPNGLMPVERALETIFAEIPTVTETQSCDLSEALDRVLGEDIISPISIPPAANSAMDGYALRSEDLEHHTTFTVVGTALAGTPFQGQVSQGECVRIMTGAVIPAGADTVVMQENVERKDDTSSVTLLHKPQRGEAVRHAGEDVEKGALVYSAGKRLSAVDIGMLATLGIARVKVFRRLDVAVLSTGDELTEPGTPLKLGGIYDSNRAVLVAMLKKMNVNVHDLGVIADDPAKIRDALNKADALADVVITSGGVSVGDADYTKDILDEIGQVTLWKLAMKPGKPLTFGKLKNSVFFGLPGNPVSSTVTFDQIAAPAIQRMSGMTPQQPLRVTAQAAAPFRKRPGRADFQRARCWVDEQGTLKVAPHGRQSSGVMSSMAQSNCFAILDIEQGSVSEGEAVTVELFSPRLSALT